MIKNRNLVVGVVKVGVVLFEIIIFLIMALLISIFIHPEPDKYYSGFFFGGFTGFFHGITISANWLLSFFYEARIIKAISYSGWYNVCWWVALIGGHLAVIAAIISKISEKD